VPDREAGGELLFADLAEGVIVEQYVLDRDAVLHGVTGCAGLGSTQFDRSERLGALALTGWSHA
jgi:hypothetical protein